MAAIDVEALNEELTRLHGQQEHAARLSELHRMAAEHFEGDPGARRFHLTHAWVYALVVGDEIGADQLGTELESIGGL
ncbi:MAG: hypothetical protein ACPGGK_00135 [Pikeienuella sp.]